MILNPSVKPALAGVALLILAACSTSHNTLKNSNTDATLWVQHAAEYKAVTTTVYNAATQLLMQQNTAEMPSALPSHQTQPNLPPAIILDVDETVLDNSAYQARLIESGQSYTTESWNRWVREEQAPPVPGAVAFTTKAAEQGIAIIYLTNRDAEVEAATKANLLKHGFPFDEENDLLLTKNERPNWDGSKQNRRAYIAERYNVIMLFGDNLGDFLHSDDITLQKRNELIGRHAKQFGTQWFMLPNPTYGAWQQALFNFDDALSEEERNQQLHRLLEGKN